MVCSSISTPGREEASDPVAMTMFLAVWVSSPTLTWPGDLDVAPEYLYFLAFSSDPALQELFEQWGYLPHEAHV